MNLLTKSFGATGLLTVALTPAGLVIDVSDSEKLSDQSIHEVIKPDLIIDELVGLLGSPSWLVGAATFVKAELTLLANK